MKTTLAAAAALLLSAGAATAATLPALGVPDDSVIDVPAGDTVALTGTVTGSGGAGDYSVTFNVMPAGTARAQAGITFLNYLGYDGLQLSWIDADGDDRGTTLASVAIPDSADAAGAYDLGTTFGPGTLSQTLQLSWADSTTTPGTLALSAQVTAVPVPAAGLLLLTALGGVAALRRRGARA